MIELRVNGAVQRVAVDDDELLLDVLRRRLGCTSVREGCGVGMCGACTFLVNGASMSSCLMLAVRADGAEITTAEGLPPDDPSQDRGPPADEFRTRVSSALETRERIRPGRVPGPGRGRTLIHSPMSVGAGRFGSSGS